MRSSEFSMASLSLGAGMWSLPMNDITRMCFFSRTTSGHGISAFFILKAHSRGLGHGAAPAVPPVDSTHLPRLCISFSAHSRMILRGFSLLKRSLKR